MNRMILFVGTEEKGYFVSDVSDKYETGVRYTGYTPNLNDAFNSILSYNYKHVIIDVEMLINDYNEIAKIVKKIMISTNSKIIIYAPGYSYQQNIIQSLFKIGVIDFILSTTLTGIKEELEIALREMNSREKVAEKINAPEEEEIKDEPLVVHTGIVNYQTIGVTGCMPRIGTTTQAIQIVKYLMLHGQKACYIEFNDNGYVDKIKKFYDGVEVDDLLGKVKYMSVDMYYKKEKISEILDLDYDYYVYDYGNFADMQNSIFHYLERNFHIFVGGTKPNEMEEIARLLPQLVEHRINYIFSFSSENEHDEICEFMQDKAPFTNFAQYTPDAFTYLNTSDAIYNSIFHLDEDEENTFKSKKGTIFRLPFLKRK